MVDWVISAMKDPRELLDANLRLIERAIAFTCREFRFGPDDAEELESIVKLHLVDKDFAVLRAWEERCSLITYIGVVVQRLALDYRNRVWGKWRASAEAKRLGALAVDLEQLLHRDRRTIEDAFAVLAAKHDGVTRESLLALAARLPEREQRHRNVDLDEAQSVASPQSASPEEPMLDQERRARSQRVSSVMAAAILELPEQDRLIVQLRFEEKMTVPQIARALQLEERQLYHRLERSALMLRRELEREGIAARDVADLIGRSETLIRFGFGKRNPRPSKHHDETEAAHSEDPQ